ncbi:MAG TPA: DUF6418 domain-containing protein [Ignavibacteria bacterium]|nr:DUF6418 domain-containing protein [Ignavibacteria bacterium]
METLYVIICMVLISLIFFYIFKKTFTDDYIIYSLIFTINAFLQASSLLYIETVKIYNIELAKFTYLNFSTLTYLFYISIFFFAFFYFTKVFKSKVDTSELKIEISTKFFVIFCIVIVTLLWVHLLISDGIPFLMDDYFSKRTFWLFYARYPEIRIILGNTSTYVCLFLGLVLLKKVYENEEIKSKIFNKYSLICMFILSAYLLYLVFIGHKFGALYQSVFLFTVPVLSYIIYKKRLRFSKRLIVMSIISFIVLFYIMLVQYENHPWTKQLGIEPHQAILYRALGLSGQMWWSANSEVFEKGTDETAITELQSGLTFLMKKYIDAKIDVEKDIEEGWNSSDGNPAILFLAFGPFITILIQIVSGIIFAFLNTKLKESVDRGSFFMIFFLLMLHASYQNAITMGNFDIFFNIKNIVIVILIIGYYIFFQKKNSKEPVLTT